VSESTCVISAVKSLSDRNELQRGSAPGSGLVYPQRVPIVYEDLRPREALLQALEQLEQLGAVVDNVFGRVVSRVAEERKRLEGLAGRLATAQAQVQSLYGSSKATTVLSPAKYPVPQDETRFRPRSLMASASATMLDAHGCVAFRRPYHISEVVHTPIAPFVDADPIKINDYKAGMLADTREAEPKHCVPIAARDAQRNQKEYMAAHPQSEGLGRLPEEGLRSVSSLLLFNTAENPYKKYSSFNNLEGWWTGRAEVQAALAARKREREKNNGDVAAQLVDAPETVEHGDELPIGQRTDYGYRPVLGDLPAMMLPPALPGLQSVADITWSGLTSEQASIAPSNTLTPQELPSSGNAPIDYSQQAPPAPAGGAAPAPPPPEPAQLQEIPGLPGQYYDPSSGGAAAAPPPPPPPPPPPLTGLSAPPQLVPAGGGEDDGAAGGSDGPLIPTGAPPQVAESGHMSLMDAIKAANGIKSLRHKPAEGEGGEDGGDGGEVEPPRPKKEEPMDMFAELKKRLGMRRTVMKNDDAGGDDGEWGDE